MSKKYGKFCLFRYLQMVYHSDQLKIDKKKNISRVGTYFINNLKFVYMRMILFRLLNYLSS